ncbi:hypothetical protein GSbR_41940 [Geobacter sp. SVR]|nr:hypothetical protein GSbR_41940 [Geobacter sp. SVR]
MLPLRVWQEEYRKDNQDDVISLDDLGAVFKAGYFPCNVRSPENRAKRSVHWRMRNGGTTMRLLKSDA